MNGFALPSKKYLERKNEQTTVIIEPTRVPVLRAFCGSLLPPLTKKVPIIDDKIPIAEIAATK